MGKQRKMKSYEDLCFHDDFMFGKVMEDKELCRDVLECLMQRPIGELTEVQTQKEFRYTSDGKPIRLDVYNEDEQGVIYDAEMENLNNKTVEFHELPKRSRFYQGSIDIDFMNKGNSYKELPESNILFVCTFDPYKKGLCQYSFRERCDEDHEIELGDGTRKVYYNCTYQGDDIPEDLRKFYDYVENGKTENELTKRIDNAVAKARKNEVWRTQYMKEWVVLQDAKDEGREEGREEGRKTTLVELVLSGDITVQRAAEKLGISKEDFEKQMMAVQSK